MNQSYVDEVLKYTNIHMRQKGENHRSCLAILEVYPFADSMSDFYPRVLEPSNFDWHVKHIFKKIVTERWRQNMFVDTRPNFHPQTVSLSKWIYKRLRINVNYRRLKHAGRTREVTKSQFPSIRNEIYFVCQLNSKGAEIVNRNIFINSLLKYIT